MGAVCCKNSIHYLSESKKIESEYSYLKNFTFKKVLSNDIAGKRIVVSGTVKVNNNTDEEAIMVLEKSVFSEDILPKMMEGLINVKDMFINDMYHNFVAKFSWGNDMKGIFMYPADDTIIKKYTPSVIEFFTETYETYESLLKPYVFEHMLSKNKWIENVFNGEAETERIFYQFKSKTDGFLLLADMKWDGKTPENAYLIAIVENAELISLRSLNMINLDMLKNIRETAYTVMSERFNVDRKMVRLIVHYHPSFWRFHVHITIANPSKFMSSSFRFHLLDQIISNIETIPNYYQIVPISCTLIKGSDIFNLYNQKV